MYIGTLTGVVLLSITIDMLAEFYIKKYFGFDFGKFSVLKRPDTFLLNMIATSFLYIICFAGISIGVLFKHWLTSAQQINELEKSTIQAELQRLKSQIHPDFLFGTLEKAGELATQDSARTSNILIKLSRFLRYQLYDSTRNEVMLSSEIASLENLLNLKKEQLKGFKYSIAIDDDSKQLLAPPLLFVSLLLLVIGEIKENENNPAINLSFNINEHLLEFTCIGTSSLGSINSDDFFNIKRRLDLLFGENYKLDLSKEERLQTIYLSFNLS
jgi:LytS/YehU family sensor histidine kinase